MMRFIATATAVFCLVCFSSTVCCSDTGSRPIADGSNQAVGSRIQEKKRIPKEDDEKKDEDDDDSGFLGMLGDCFNMLNFFSELSELCGGDEEVGDAETEKTVPAEEVQEWLFYEGLVDPVDQAVGEAEIWTVAGGEGNGGRVVRIAPRGMRLRVMGRSYSLNNYWLLVGPAEHEEVYGWIRQIHVIEVSESGSGE